MVVGSQADKKGLNKLTVLRMSDLCRIPGSGREKTEKELDDEMLGEEWKHDDEEDDEEDSSSEEEEEEEELDPVLEHYSFPHPSGGINRIRVCPHNRDIVGCWGDGGTVSLYDIGGALDVLDRSAAGANNNRKKNESHSAVVGASSPPRPMKKDPFFVYSGHATEGYAIDWSRVTPGRLATADCRGNIHVWNAAHPVLPNDIAAHYEKKKRYDPWSTSSFVVEPTYAAHGENLDHPSVEDLQWSPNEATVLASGECGGVVRIYDVRCPGKAMISNKIHKSGADVNVIAWNRLVSNLLASGGDDGECGVASIVLWIVCGIIACRFLPIYRFDIPTYPLSHDNITPSSIFRKHTKHPHTHTSKINLQRSILRMGSPQLPIPRPIQIPQTSRPLPLPPHPHHLPRMAPHRRIHDRRFRRSRDVHLRFEHRGG